MRIKRIRDTVATVSGLAIFIICIMLVWAFWTVSNASTIHRNAIEISNAASDLQYLTLDTMLYFERRSEEQWRSKYEELTQFLNQFTVGPHQRESLEQLKAGHAMLNAVYPRLIEYHRAAAAGGPESDKYRELETRAAVRLHGASHEILSDSFELARTSQENVAVAQRNLALLSAAFAALIALLASANWFLITYTVLRPLHALQTATRRLANGDLAYRLDLKRNSETGSLAGAFDDMASKIQNATMSLQENREALKRANDELELRVAERTAELQQVLATLEERVQQRTRQLEAANQELEAFTYSVSHDLRAPLRHIAGFAEMLNEHRSSMLDAACKHYLANITDSVQEMGQLIDDLLNFSRIGRVEMRHERVDMQAIVREVATELGAHVTNRTIQWDIKPMPEVVADPSMVRQVWVNLISNAIKFSGRREVAKVEIGCLQNEDSVEFYIADNGAGFDMEYSDKLFGVFQRLHRQEDFDGTGVGLANVQRIVMRHGGRTRAFGKVGDGATFYFTLPRTLEQR